MMQDITQQELSDFIFPAYDVDSGIPEHPAIQMDMDNFLDYDFNVDVVTKKELEGGLNGYGIILENVFTRRECKRIIEETERIGYGHLGTNKTGNAYRGRLFLNCFLWLI